MPKRMRAGDLVEIRPPEEILATLDDTGCLDGMPFMPEMLRFTGQRFRVSARAHKTCDTVNQTGGRRLEKTVHLDDLRCDGSGHGGCDAHCLLFWKDAWIKKVEQDAAAPLYDQEPTKGQIERLQQQAFSQDTGSGRTIYRCQATQLYDATEPLRWWDPGHYLEDLTSGNTRPVHMLRVWFFHALHKLMGIGVGYRAWHWLYDRLQSRVGGHAYPFRAGLVPAGAKTPSRNLDLQPGDAVRIKSHEEILRTLNFRKQNRGMRFDEEMVPYCGKTFTVRKRVNRIINEKTGEMMEMGTPSIIMDGVVCRSEFSECRLFCPRAIPSYWREIWLERVTAPSDR